MEAIILAGGFGTRLASVVTDVPKPMAPVAEQPFLKYIVEDLINQGIKKIIIAVCYKKECIMDYFKDNYKGIEIEYSIEDHPLKTGGAIKQALEKCKNDKVFVINGDTYFEVDLCDMSNFSQQYNSNVVIAVRRMLEFSRYGQVVIQDNKIEMFKEKEYCTDGLINGGIYLLSRKILEDYPVMFSLEDDFFPKILENEKIFAYESKGYFIDIGVPEDYLKAQEYFRGM